MLPDSTVKQSTTVILLFITLLYDASQLEFYHDSVAKRISYNVLNVTVSYIYYQCESISREMGAVIFIL